MSTKPRKTKRKRKPRITSNALELRVALAFVAELEAIYRGLIERRFVGVNHPRVKFRLPVKRVLMERFPFAVVFFAEADTVRVVAVEALRRHPGYWRSRLRGQ